VNPALTATSVKGVVLDVHGECVAAFSTTTRRPAWRWRAGDTSSSAQTPTPVQFCPGASPELPRNGLAFAICGQRPWAEARECNEMKPTDKSLA